MQHSEIIDRLGGYRFVAAQLKKNRMTVASWKSRSSIPVDDWSGIIWIAKKHKLPITLEDLHNGY